MKSNSRETWLNEPFIEHNYDIKRWRGNDKGKAVTKKTVDPQVFHHHCASLTENETPVRADIKTIFHDKNYNRSTKSSLRATCSGKFWDLAVLTATPHRYNKYSGSCTFCCGRPSGLLCWLRGAGKENSESTLWKDIPGKREVNSSTSGDDLEKKMLNRWCSRKRQGRNCKWANKRIVSVSGWLIDRSNEIRSQTVHLHACRGIWCNDIHVTLTERVDDSCHSPVNQMSCYSEHLVIRKRK